jgi:protocatechuate 3,4-dioxygenase beta subunit
MLPFLLSMWLLVAAQNTSTLQGVVLRAGSSEPIPNVEITLSGDAGRFKGVADAQGTFRFDSLPASKYQMTAARDGYFTPQGTALPGFIASVTIEANRAQQVAVNLIAGAAISGRITDSDDKPVAGVQVTATKLQYEDGRSVFSAGTAPIATNERGEYRIAWLPPGEYYIRAEFKSPTEDFVRRTYYPGTTDSLAAVALTIRGGEVLEGQNFRIPRAKTIRLSGEVRTSAPLPTSGSVRSFYLMPQDGRPQESYPFELTNTIRATSGEPTAAFLLEARGIPPGLYELAPFLIDPRATYHTGRTPVEIGGEDIENIAAIISPNVDVTGKIIVNGAAAVPNLSGLSLQLRARDATVPLMSRSATAAMAPDGSFVIRGVTGGRYYVYLNASARGALSGLYVSGMRLGALDIRNDGVVDIRSSTDSLEITLSSGAGSIDGVVDTFGETLPTRATVVLVPQFSRWANPLFYDRALTDDAGHFKFEGIAPGEYKVFAFEQLPLTAEQNPSFIARYEALGQSVTVNSGSSTEVRARVLR